MASQNAARAGTVSGPEEGLVITAKVRCACPACGEPVEAAAIEQHGEYGLFGRPVIKERICAAAARLRS